MGILGAGSYTNADEADGFQMINVDDDDGDDDDDGCNLQMVGCICCIATY